MTLIHSAANQHVATQVSDRLVTRGETAYDTLANKNVVYFGPDSVMSFGYSGPAYRGQDKAPTDQWIMDVLQGESNPGGPRERGTTLRVGRPAPQAPTLKDSLKRLQEALSDSVQYLPANAKNMGFELVGCGWQREPEGTFDAVLCGIADSGGKHQFEIWGPGAVKQGQVTLAITPRALKDRCNLPKLLERLGKAESEKEFVGILTDKIQTVGAQVPQVGRDCMCIVIRAPTIRVVEVEFKPMTTHTGIIADKLGKAMTPAVPVAYTPWIVGSTIEVPPNVLLGGHGLHIDGWTVRFNAPYNPTSGGVVRAISSQRRKKSP